MVKLFLYTTSKMGHQNETLHQMQLYSMITYIMMERFSQITETAIKLQLEKLKYRALSASSAKSGSVHLWVTQ
jgi:hypothetical protein